MAMQGRQIGERDLDLVRGLWTSHPDWNRTRLSRELCARWDWRNAQGRPKDMAARTLLLKLERAGHLRLPVPQRPGPNARRNRQTLDLPYDRTPIEGALGDLQPVRIELSSEGHRDWALFRFLLQRHHYLGLRNSVGENLKYLARDRRGLGVLVCSPSLHRRPDDGPPVQVRVNSTPLTPTPPRRARPWRRHHHCREATLRASGQALGPARFGGGESSDLWALRMWSARSWALYPHRRGPCLSGIPVPDSGFWVMRA